MEKVKLYRSIIELEIISDDPIDQSSIGHINYMINEGGWSGLYTTKSQDIPIEGKEAVNYVKNQGSDPEFFGMDAEGNAI